MNRTVPSLRRFPARVPALALLPAALALALATACGACGERDRTSEGAAVAADAATPEGAAGEAGNAAEGGAAALPSLEAPAPLTLEEEEPGTVTMRATAIARFDAVGLPPGARMDVATGTITFQPDFTQSGTYDVAVTGRGQGAHAAFEKTVHAVIVVRDSITPPAPVVVSSTPGNGFTRLVVRQTTDAFLDSATHAGRTIDAVVVIPSVATAAQKAPVVVSLHGFGGAPNAAASSATTYRIEPHDPDDTYWWGYGETLPAAPPGAGTHVHPYTVRRVLHLLAWLLRTYPGADPDRAFATGGSMGGGGALTLGLLHARHFAGVEASIAPTIPRNHRPSRLRQLTTLWGSPAANLDDTWDRLDVTRVVRDVPEAREQFVFTKHGKDDPTIHFGAVVTPSALTKKTFYGALEDERIGHLSIWDEGAHGPADPVLGPGWWDAAWSRIADDRSYLTRRSAFPAFSRSSANGNPGDGTGNGKTAFDPERGYSAVLAVAGDCGWSGELAGALNRFLRWDTPDIRDGWDSLVIPLRVVVGPGEAAPGPGYPTKRDRYDGPLPIRVDVTPRRVHAFRTSPGEKIRYRFGDVTGTVTASADGSVTVPGLPLTTTTTRLELLREAP